MITPIKGTRYLVRYHLPRDKKDRYIVGVFESESEDKRNKTYRFNLRTKGEQRFIISTRQIRGMSITTLQPGVFP